MDIKTKFSLDQQVWLVSTKRQESWESCKVCDGSGTITVKDNSYRCPECYSHGGKKVYSDKQEHYVYVHGIIGNVRAEFYSAQYDNDDEIVYMLDVTGVGSGTLWKENQLFESEEAAKRYCVEQNKLTFNN